MQLNARQVHLDFHTSEKIENIGKNFSKEQFQAALKAGHVNSITVFSKCHHGWAYHPSKANETHPHLGFDLLGAQIEAAHEIGVKTPVYLSAGLDEKMARRHPEWLLRNKDETNTWTSDFSKPGYHLMCMNSPYLDYFLEQLREVVQNYDADGIFLDIVGVHPCYCQHCIKSLLEEGKDPYDEKNIADLAERVYAHYAKRVREVIDSVKPGLPVFHNAGHITRGRRDFAQFNTHLELESLPTGGWGYDHFPLSAAYVRTLGMEFLGMTGKFHMSWGEFGGFKHPNALRYEVALSAANGAKCSIGDQMHPSGEMDMATYKLIGSAYKELEALEEWVYPAKHVADIGVVSVQAACADEGMDRTGVQDTGAVRMLLEGNYLFNVIDLEEDFENYKVLILPDCITIDAPLGQKLRAFIENGGKVLATGRSGLKQDLSGFALDFGVAYKGPSPYKPEYFRPGFELAEWDNTAFVMYEQGQTFEVTTGDVLGVREYPYFNRSTFSFCSHRQTPSAGKDSGPAMVRGKDGIYIAWELFSDYAQKGSLIDKRMVQYALDALLEGQKTVQTTLPAQGVLTLTEQENRNVLHLLYASPVKRGEVEVIEDIVPLYGVEAAVRVNRAAKRVYTAPDRAELPFDQENGVVRFEVPVVKGHQAVVIEY